MHNPKPIQYTPPHKKHPAKPNVITPRPTPAGPKPKPMKPAVPMPSGC